MIIDARDLLYSKNVDAFELMTSDSDFLPLVLRLLESGLPVYGFGENKTPTPFVDACFQFIYTENLISDDPSKAVEGESPKSTKRTRNELRSDTILVHLLRTAEKTADDAGGYILARSVSSYVITAPSQRLTMGTWRWAILSEPQVFSKSTCGTVARWHGYGHQKNPKISC